MKHITITTGNEALLDDATKAGRSYRNAIARGDISAEVAFNNSGVGYPYMTAHDAVCAFAEFCRAAHTLPEQIHKPVERY